MPPPKNTPVLERYIASVESLGVAARVEDETPDRFTQLIDYLTLGLRLREGVSLAAFSSRFGLVLKDVLGETGDWLISEGFLELDEERLRITADHQLITNEILVKLDEPLADYVRRETSASQIAVR